MSGNDVIADALKLASGARFVRCALQVNPHHYRGTFRGDHHGGGAEEYIRAIIDTAQELDISVLAVTDHNSVSDISAFRSVAEDTRVTIFPGFELESTDGIHVLCIYSPKTSIDQMGRFLGEFGVRDTEPSSSQCNQGFDGVLSRVREQGGITIAAHSTSEKGVLRALHGQARSRAWQNADLLAVQIPRSADDLSDDVRQIAQNRDAAYRRDHPVALVNAKDVARPEDLHDDSATCWIKMSDSPDCESLRQAFLDPDSRIRLNSHQIQEEHSELIAMTWEGGGFLDGAAIHFSQNLNVLVGGRGTGKSTIIESLRYVLDLEPKSENALRSHKEVVRHVIKNGSKLSLLVRSHRPSNAEYTIERTVPNPPVVRDDNGEILQLQPSDVLPRIEVYGQHEISELTSNEHQLTSLLRRFVQADDSLGRRKAEVLQELRKSRLALVQAQSEYEDIEERLAELPRLKETLSRFQEAGLEERLRDRSLLVREERVIESIPERMQVLRDVLETTRSEIPLDTAFVSEKALDGLPGGTVLRRAEDILGELSAEFEVMLQRMESALDRADGGIESIRLVWSERRQEVEAEYQSILRQLQKSAVDGEEFIRLRHDIERLQPLSKQRELLQHRIDEHRQRRRRLLDEWESLKAGEFRDLDRAARRVSERLRGRVRVAVVSAGDRQPLFDLLGREIQGRLSEAVSALRGAEELSLPEFAGLCRQGAEPLAAKYGLTPRQAQLLAGASENTLMQVEEVELPATTELSLNTATAGDEPTWTALTQLSKGQKATAVLLLLLLESDAPLVIDQPEDDLDNRFITEGVVPRIREEKRRRQFVFSTHNANIPVLGDAELILGLDASGEAGEGKAFLASEHMGSIDSPSVRALVEEVLEGGRHAFETRRRKYGF